MFQMVMTFPQATTRSVKRPKFCPYCHSPILQRWGRISKPLLDIHSERMVIYRYRCSDCQRTFRFYPPGVNRVNRSQRLRTLAGITWALGLSLDAVVQVFQSLGIELSRTTIWRDGQEIGQLFRDSGTARAVTFLGNRKNLPPTPYLQDEVTLILQLGQARLAIGIVDEQGPYAAKRWLESLAAQVGLEVAIENQSHTRIN